MLLVLFSFGSASLPSGAFNFSVIFLSNDFRLEIPFHHITIISLHEVIYLIRLDIRTTQFHKLNQNFIFPGKI